MLSDSHAKVSVIVPIMNVERFLDQCLNSIQDQTYQNLEIILINDGSTDHSLDIMEKHAENDPRIRIIDKPNEGYGASCNRGINEATGQWISIIEPDDWIDSDMYQDMLDFATAFEEPIDIIKTSWYDEYRWNDPKLHESNICFLKGRMNTSKKPFTLAGHPVLIEGHPSIWTCLYSKEFLDRNDIRFIPYPGAGWADNPFLMETLLEAKSIIYLDKPFYHYRTDIPGSTLHHKTEAAVAMPFDRWIEMMDILERKSIDDLGIIQAHYFRGFKYLQGAMVDDGWENPIVQQRARAIFDRMDPQIIASHPKLSPKDKALYFETTEQEPLPIDRTAYPRHIIKEGFHSLRNSGITPTLKRISRVAKRASKDVTDASRYYTFKPEDIE